MPITLHRVILKYLDNKPSHLHTDAVCVLTMEIMFSSCTNIEFENCTTFWNVCNKTRRFIYLIMVSYNWFTTYLHLFFHLAVFFIYERKLFITGRLFTYWKKIVSCLTSGAEPFRRYLWRLASGFIRSVRIVCAQILTYSSTCSHCTITQRLSKTFKTIAFYLYKIMKRCNLPKKLIATQKILWPGKIFRYLKRLK